MPGEVEPPDDDLDYKHDPDNINAALTQRLLARQASARAATEHLLCDREAAQLLPEPSCRVSQIELDKDAAILDRVLARQDAARGVPTKGKGLRKKQRDAKRNKKNYEASKLDNVFLHSPPSRLENRKSPSHVLLRRSNVQPPLC